MGREAKEASVNSNKQELMNFLKTCEESYDNDETSEHKRNVKLFRYMKIMAQSSFIPRLIRRIIQAILDTGSSGNNMPQRIVSEIGCEEIDNQLKHVPINTVLGKYFCNTITIVPVLEEVSTSPNSDFIILSFDVAQCNSRIKKEIKLNDEGSAIGQTNLSRSK